MIQGMTGNERRNKILISCCITQDGRVLRFSARSAPGDAVAAIFNISVIGLYAICSALVDEAWPGEQSALYNTALLYSM